MRKVIASEIVSLDGVVESPEKWHFLDAGAEAQQVVKDVGGGKLIASVNDSDGNVIGLIQLA
jgi:hypothetical protein